MSYTLEKQKTGSTPYILIDEENGYMKFEGESFHENVIDFYKEISEWLYNYLKSDFKILTFDCKLQYFNSSTAKLLYNMLASMDDHAVDGKKIVVNWITTHDNEIILECGEDFQEDLVNVEFNILIK